MPQHACMHPRSLRVLFTHMLAGMRLLPHTNPETTQPRTPRRTGTQLESFLAVLKHVEVVQDQLWPHRVAALWRATDSWGGAPQGEGLGPGLASPGGQGLQVGQGQGGGPASPGVVPVGMGRTNLVARFGAPGSLLDDGEEGEAGLTHHHHHQPLQQQQQQVDYLAWQQQQQERWHAAAAAGSSRAGQGSAGGAERLQGLGGWGWRVAAGRMAPLCWPRAPTLNTAPVFHASFLFAHAHSDDL